MTERDTFTMAEEFADVDFNEERLEKRFRKIYGNLVERSAEINIRQQREPG
jgi:hypothetical protein